MSITSVSNISNISQLPDTVLVSIFRYCSFECTGRFFEHLLGGKQVVEKKTNLWNARNIIYFDLIQRDSSQHPKSLKLFLLTIKTIFVASYIMPNSIKNEITSLNLSNYPKIEKDKFQVIVGWCPALTTLELSFDMIDNLSTIIPKRIDKLIVNSGSQIILKGLNQIKILVVKTPILEVIDCRALCNLSEIIWEYTPNKNINHHENLSSSLKNIHLPPNLKSFKLMCKDESGSHYLNGLFSIEEFKPFSNPQIKIPEDMILSYESPMVIFERKYNKDFGVFTNDLLIRSSRELTLFQSGSKNVDSNRTGTLFLPDGTKVTGEWDHLYIPLKDAFFVDNGALKNVSRDISIRLVGENIFIGMMQRGLSNTNQLDIITYQGDFIIYRGDGSVCNCEYVENNLIGDYKITYPNGVIYEDQVEDGKFTFNGIFTLNGKPYEEEIRNFNLHKAYKYVYPDGSTYQGGFKNGLPHGQGKRTFPDGESYQGGFKDGKYHGQGGLTYSDGKFYIGGFKDGKYHGQGKLIFPNGRGVYQGGFKKGLPHGQGKKTFPDGAVYQGGFKNGKFDGQGMLTYPNGGSYQGEFIDGKYHGQGTQIFPDDEMDPDQDPGSPEFFLRYQGNFNNGIRHGQGTLIDPNYESVYKGNFKDGKPNGRGIQIFRSGKVHYGEFKDGKANGKGMMIFPKGKIHIGEFKKGLPHGRFRLIFSDGSACETEIKDTLRDQVKLTFSDGTVYQGEYKDWSYLVVCDRNKFDGQGKLTLPNGESYQGEFKDGKYHGQGTLTFLSGKVHKGEFKNGLPYGRATITFPDGSVREEEFEKTNDCSIM